MSAVQNKPLGLFSQGKSNVQWCGFIVDNYGIKQAPLFIHNLRTGNTGF